MEKLKDTLLIILVAVLVIAVCKPMLIDSITFSRSLQQAARLMNNLNNRVENLEAMQKKVISESKEKPAL